MRLVLRESSATRLASARRARAARRTRTVRTQRSSATPPPEPVCPEGAARRICTVRLVRCVMPRVRRAWRDAGARGTALGRPAAVATLRASARPRASRTVRPVQWASVTRPSARRIVTVPLASVVALPLESLGHAATAMRTLSAVPTARAATMVVASRYVGGGPTTASWRRRPAAAPSVAWTAREGRAAPMATSARTWWWPTAAHAAALTRSARRILHSPAVRTRIADGAGGA
jgi:hypothetical protein